MKKSDQENRILHTPRILCSKIENTQTLERVDPWKSTDSLLRDDKRPHQLERQNSKGFRALNVHKSEDDSLKPRCCGQAS